MSERPGHRVVDSWHAAEDNAAVWMRYWGFADARVTSSGADAGIDVRSQNVIAQVKYEAHKVGRPALQRLVGARCRGAEDLLFFSGAGYSKAAREYADEMRIALFTYELNGAVQPLNPAAKDIYTRREILAAERARQRQEAAERDRGLRGRPGRATECEQNDLYEYTRQSGVTPAGSTSVQQSCLAVLGVMVSLLLVVLSLFNFVRNTWNLLTGTAMEDLHWAALFLNLAWALGFSLAMWSMLSRGRFRWFWPLPYFALLGFYTVMD